MSKLSMQADTPLIGRRRLMHAGLGLIAGAALPSALCATLPERRLAFRNVHTGEKVDARYFGAAGYDAQGIAELNHGLRDWRTGDTFAIDHDLFDLLSGIRDRLGVSARTPFDLISGYRSPATNGALHEKSHGVATKSQHMLGKATDVALSGISLDRLRLAAVSARRGGVGIYPKDGFVHIDTGRVRYW